MKFKKEVERGHFLNDKADERWLELSETELDVVIDHH